MRILQTHPYCWPYMRRGTERTMDTFARYLVRQGHDVSVLSTLPAGASPPVNGTIRHVLRRSLWTPAMALARMQPEHLFGISTYLDLQALEADVVHSFFYT